MVWGPCWRRLMGALQLTAVQLLYLFVPPRPSRVLSVAMPTSTAKWTSGQQAWWNKPWASSQSWGSPSSTSWLVWLCKRMVLGYIQQALASGTTPVMEPALWDGRIRPCTVLSVPLDLHYNCLEIIHSSLFYSCTWFHLHSNCEYLNNLFLMHF